MSRSISISIPDVSKARRAAINQKQNIDENDIHNFLPVTPQRLNRPSKQIRSVTSPLTPKSLTSSPFTPITNRYSPASSIATPSSSVSSKTKVDSSPELVKSSGQKSPADSIGNWRARARDASNSSVQSNKEEVSIKQFDVPASFLSTHRRSRTAQFQSKSSDIVSLASPGAARLPMSELTVGTSPMPPKSLASLNTPSPRSTMAIVSKLKVQGSMTDPARTRRRPALGPNFDESLLDIDELNDEEEYSAFDSPVALRSSSRMRSASESQASFLPNNAALSQYMQGAFFTSGVAVDVSSATDNCSVCSAASKAVALSVLVPCGHLVCSACLTGALNIVGEKDMRCAVCESNVENFKLLSPGSSLTKKMKAASDEDDEDEESHGLRDSSPLLPSMFADLRLSSPVVDNVMSPITSSFELAVLRIDNVPWDITPPALSDFFSPCSITMAHVLLDPKGKTLSHAYIELPMHTARQALRSVQNKTLGKGKRMRGVTVTMSSQSELMRALFPSWQGSFDGAKLSLANVDPNQVYKVLGQGLMSLNEFDSLIALIRNPSSHFLKVPSLPFYCLISILTKFPTDDESCMLWNANLGPVLFEMARGSIQTLISRIDGPEHDQYLLDRVILATVNCFVFSDQERMEIIKLRNSLPSIPDTTSTDSISDLGTPDNASYASAMSPLGRHCVPLASPVFPSHSMAFPQTGMMMNSSMISTPYDVLAREFGVQPDLVHAVAQRLAMSGSSMPIHYR